MTKQHDEILHEKFNGVYHGNLIIFDADDMRAVADWQLEQVVHWMRDNLQDHRYSGIGIDVDYVIEALAQAMRPTTTGGQQ